MAEQIKLKDLKKGDTFKRKPDARAVFVRGHFARDGGFNKYSCTDWDDINREIFLKGDTVVFVGFDF